MNHYWTRGLGTYLIRHPFDGPVVVRAAWRLRRSGWWRRAPYLPVPYSPYWNFRLTTVNGSDGATPSPKEIVNAAKWSLSQRVGQ